MKICPKCKVEKELKEFSKAKGRKDGLSGWCKPCHQKVRKKWYGSNKNRVKQVNGVWISNNKERHYSKNKEWSLNNKERHKKLIADWDKKNPEKVAAKRKRHINKLPDSYIKGLLIHKSGFPKEAVEQYPILIDIRRISVKTKREIKKQTA